MTTNCLSETASTLRAAPAMSRSRLGSELRRLRKAHSISLNDAAAHLDVATSTLSRMETGNAPIKTRYLKDLLDLYGVDDQARRDALADLARNGRHRGWWEPHADLLPTGFGNYLDLEAAATSVRLYSVQTVPDLVQTAAYAAAASRAARPELADHQVRTLVTVQLRRQELSRDNGCRLHMIIDEGTLLRCVGDAEIMAGQLEHLHTMTAHPMMSVQVIQLASATQALCSPFTVLSFADPADPDVACGGSPGGMVNLTRRDADLRSMTTAFVRLTRQAMSPGCSADLIDKIASDWRQSSA